MADMVKWDPFQDMTGFFDELDNLFNYFMKSFSEELYASQMAGNRMNLQVKEDGKDLVITGDIPNAVKDNIDVVLRHDSVVISGESKLQKEKEGSKEFQWSKFSRACSLPVGINSEQAKIDFQKGKLIIRAPKK